MTETASPAAQTTRPCECSLWTTADGAKLTDCAAQTNSKKKTFRPGHDAKLKGALIRAKHAGTEVSDGRGVSGAPEDLAARFGFGHMVASATKREKKAAAPAAEAIAAEEEKHEEAEIAAAEAEALARVAKATAPRRSRPSRKAAANA